MTYNVFSGTLNPTQSLYAEPNHLLFLSVRDVVTIFSRCIYSFTNIVVSFLFSTLLCTKRSCYGSFVYVPASLTRVLYQNVITLLYAVSD